MTDDAEDLEEGAPTEDAVWERETAPQSPFTMRDVGLGLLILGVAAVVAFALPILVT